MPDGDNLQEIESGIGCLAQILIALGIACFFVVLAVVVWVTFGQAVAR